MIIYQYRFIYVSGANIITSVQCTQEQENERSVYGLVQLTDALHCCFCVFVCLFVFRVDYSTVSYWSESIVIK